MLLPMLWRSGEENAIRGMKLREQPLLVGVSETDQLHPVGLETIITSPRPLINRCQEDRRHHLRSLIIAWGKILLWTLQMNALGPRLDILIANIIHTPVIRPLRRITVLIDHYHPRQHFHRVRYPPSHTCPHPLSFATLVCGFGTSCSRCTRLSRRFLYSGSDAGPGTYLVHLHGPLCYRFQWPPLRHHRSLLFLRLRDNVTHELFFFSIPFLPHVSFFLFHHISAV